MRTENDASLDPRQVRDKALGLRESVNSARLRMISHREQLARLRAEVTVLRELAALGAAPPAVSSIPSPLPVRADAAPPAPVAMVSAPPAPMPVLAVPVPALAVPAPVVKEAAADSAPAAAPFRADFGPFARRAAPYAAIVAFAIAFELKPAPRPSAGLPLAAADAAAPQPAADAARPAPLAFADDGADEALLLVHEWRVPGDERTIAERLDPGVQLPGAEPAWSAERTGERVYRVSYRPPAGAPAYDFDVDLDARRVDPTPDTAELIAPRLTARR